jgi:uncharacterized protein YecA (UPF0149 family)
VDFVDITDATWAARRRYKTRWERAKRQRLREAEFEVVELEIPRSLAKKLHAWTPKGVGFKNFLRQLLSAGVGGKPAFESIVVEPRVVVSRNARCPCGSGRKFKRCCGEGR